MTEHVSIESCVNGCTCSTSGEEKGGHYQKPDKTVHTDHESLMKHVHKHTKHMFEHGSKVAKESGGGGTKGFAKKIATAKMKG